MVAYGGPDTRYGYGGRTRGGPGFGWDFWDTAGKEKEGEAPVIPGIHLPGINFQSIDPSGLNMIKSRLDEANKLAADPLSAPGIQASLQSLQANLSRRAESARGAAMGRAASTGQGGFQGALAEVGGDIEARQGEAFAGAQADMAQKIFQQARAEGLSLTDALNRANMETARLQTEQAGMTAQQQGREAELNARISMQNAEMKQKQHETYLMKMLDMAKLAEQQREFNTQATTQEKELGLKGQAQALAEKQESWQEKLAGQELGLKTRAQTAAEEQMKQENMANRLRTAAEGARAGFLPFGQAQKAYEGYFGGFGQGEYVPSFSGGGWLTNPWNKQKEEQ